MFSNFVMDLKALLEHHFKVINFYIKQATIVGLDGKQCYLAFLINTMKAFAIFCGTGLMVL